MAKRIFAALLMVSCAIGSAAPLQAFEKGGALEGKVTDKQGFPLPGAFIYVASPSLLGIHNYITSDTGNYYFPDLPPGTYKITVEMPGFKKVAVNNMTISVGRTVVINFELEATDIEEEITSREASPMVDGRSAKLATALDRPILKHIPRARDFSDIVGLAPGAAAEDNAFGRDFAFQGAPVRANIFSVEGVNVTDPVGAAPFMDLDVDAVDEVEVTAAAHPAEHAGGAGAYIRVVAKSGSNRRSGRLSVFHTGSHLAQQPWSEKELADNNLSVPRLGRRHWDFSLSLAGPFQKDRLWYFTNLRFKTLSKDAPFKEWADPTGLRYKEFDTSRRDLHGLLKLSALLSSRFRAQITFAYSDEYQPAYDPDLGWNIPQPSTRIMDNAGLLLAFANAVYSPDQNSSIDMGLSYAGFSLPLLLNSAGRDKPRHYDYGSGNYWGSGPYNEASQRKRVAASVFASRLMDGFGAGIHRVKAGADLEITYSDLSTWKTNNLLVNHAFGSPYLFGRVPSPVSGNTVGKGLISFYLASMERSGLIQKNEYQRLGFCLQDSMTFAGRLTLNLGIRFDRSQIHRPSSGRAPSGNAVSVKIGEELLLPLVGLNPYGQVEVPEWKNMITWNSFAPRASLAFDPGGSGRTLLKLSYADYPEYPSLMYSQQISFFLPTRAHSFEWYDENSDGLVDEGDSFSLSPDDYRIYAADDQFKRVSPNLKAPRTEELTAGIDHEFLRDFSVSFRFVLKRQKNIIEDVLHDPDIEKNWYVVDSTTADWWIPFKTSVPTVDDYPETEVTAYFLSKDAPALFTRLDNVPELQRKYRGVELVLRKRMSHNWQLLGSLAWGRAAGNAGLNAPASSGYSEAANGANYFVNLTANSRLDLDRPLMAKLMGTYVFPGDIYFSFLFSHASGTPWGRTVTIVPPESWTVSHRVQDVPAVVRLEEPGSRRHPSLSTLDLRIEREFAVGERIRLLLYADILNALGEKDGLMDLNDSGFWYPESEDSGLGKRILSSTYKKYTGLRGVRSVQLSLSLKF